MDIRKNGLSFYFFTLIVTLFAGVCFTSSDFVTIPAVSFADRTVLFFQWLVVVVALYFLITLLAVNKYIFAVFFLLLTLFSSLLAWFRLTTHTTLTPMILDATLQNDARTSADLITPGLIAFVFVSLLISIGFVYRRIRKVRLQTPLFTTCISLLLLVGVTQVDPFKRPISERIPFNVYYTVQKYWKEKQVLRENRIDLSEGVTCGEDSLTVVLVIGESLRPDHLGINGYERNTTPSLSKEDVISFPHIYTEQTYTNRSIPHLLTRADSTDYTRAYTEKSVVNLFNACNYHTAWLANQEAANTYAYFMNECDTLAYVNAGKSPYVFDRWVDGDLLPLFTAHRQRPESRKLIILHTIGSHWWYNSHYTDAFAVYKPVVRSKVVSSNTREAMINSYDNTVLYTDHFLYNLIDQLRDQKAILIYQSDHGESLGEDGIWLHATESPYTHQAACLIWMSASYKQAHPAYYEQARLNSIKRYRTDYLFHTLLDAAGIGSVYKDYSLSLFR